MSTNDILERLMRHRVRHFGPGELWSPRAGVPPHPLLWQIMPTVLVADVLRRRLGVPLNVTSGYRSPEYNRSVGGAEDSLHRHFNALDLKPRDGDVGALHQAALEHPMADLMGIGVYRTFVHIDTRGVLGRTAPARWRG